MKESNTKSIYAIKRKEKYVVRNSSTNEIGKVIFPHPVLFGVGSDQVAGGLSGSLQQTVGGLSYLVAGGYTTITTGSNGQITISSPIRTKKFFEITEPLANAQPYNCSPIDFTTVNFNPDRIDVFLNGQILRPGSGNDYLLQETSSILFNTALDQGDNILVILF
tara:strand:- start:539 stop:1030 length:492 start_codon:yes stop_codon:yes gene_type:complete